MTERPRILALFGSAVLFGQERGNIEALAALQKQGCEVLCLVRDEAWNKRIPSALEARGLAWMKVPYIEHRLPGRMRYIIFRNPVAFVLANWRFFRIVREFRPTHIHAFNQLYVLNFLIGLIVLKVPMVFRAGDEPTVHNWVWRAVWWFVARRADRFVANSGFVARLLREHGVSDRHISVIYNMPPQRIGAIVSLPPILESEEMCRVTYVGQIIEDKGVHLLVEAFQKVVVDYSNAQLVIAGRISEWSGDAWARQLRDSVLENPLLCKQVLFVGEIADVPSLLSRTRIHVLPSLINDASPNVIMEAKQAACPSIVFPFGGMQELVLDGIDGWVCREATSEGIAEALRCYLGNPGLAYRHGQAALASLVTLGVDQFAERWLNVYAGGAGQCQNILVTHEPD